MEYRRAVTQGLGQLGHRRWQAPAWIDAGGGGDRAGLVVDRQINDAGVRAHGFQLGVQFGVVGLDQGAEQGGVIDTGAFLELGLRAFDQELAGFLDLRGDDQRGGDDGDHRADQGEADVQRQARRPAGHDPASREASSPAGPGATPARGRRFREWRGCCNALPRSIAAFRKKTNHDMVIGGQS